MMPFIVSEFPANYTFQLNVILGNGVIITRTVIPSEYKLLTEHFISNLEPFVEVIGSFFTGSLVIDIVIK